MKRFAVILSGCGHRDGTEITEAVSALIALSERGASYTMFAPTQMFRVTNPLTGATTQEDRDILTEAARIARGKIHSLQELEVDKFDGLVFPGGFGVALHLCTWAQTGSRCEVRPDIERIIKDFYVAEKPIAGICIAPALLARVLGPKGITLTIGNDAATAAEITKTGARHADCAVDDFITDREHRIITTPAYMYDDAKPFAVFTGVRKAIAELVEMA